MFNKSARIALPFVLFAALFATACAALMATAFSMGAAWADDSTAKDRVCGYAYLDEIDPDAGESGGYRLVIQATERAEDSEYRYLGPVKADYEDLETRAKRTGIPKALPWCYDNFAEIVFEGGVAPVSIRNWFFGVSATSVDFSGLDGSRLEDASGAFNACEALQLVDLSNFKAPKLSNLEYLFWGCDSLEKAHFKDAVIGSGDEAGEASLAGMFEGCKRLKSVDFSGLHVPKATSFRSLFYNCRSLTDVKTEGMSAPYVTNTQAMFNGCASLENARVAWGDASVREGGKKVYAARMFSGCAKLSKVEFPENGIALSAMWSMFEGCGALREIDLSTVTFDSGNGEGGAGNGAAAFNYCPLEKVTLGSGFQNEQALSGLFNIAASWASDETECSSPGAMLDCVPEAGAALFVPSGDPEGVFVYLADASSDASTCTIVLCPKRPESLPTDAKALGFAGDAAIFSEAEDAEKPDPYRPWVPLRESIGAVRFERGEGESGDPVKPIGSISGWFEGCGRLTQLEGLDNFDTSEVTSMASLFKGCVSLTSLDLSAFDTSSVVNMSKMFEGCTSLASLTLPNASDGSAGFDTSQVTNMTEMFRGCCSLAKLELPECFFTSQVKHMSGMFHMGDAQSNTSALESLVLPSGFSTASTQSLRSLLAGCSSLRELKVPSGFTVAGMTDLSGMFSGCASLTDFGGLRLDTSEATNLSNMFSGCSSLGAIDLSSFDTAKATRLDYLFDGCSSLGTLDLSRFTTSAETNVASMLAGCSSLASVTVPATMAAMPSFPEGMWSSDASSGNVAGYRYDRIPAGVAATYMRVPGDDGNGWQDACYWAVLARDGSLTVSASAREAGAGEQLYRVWENATYGDATDVPWHDRSADVKSVVIRDDNVSVASIAHWFSGCTALKTAVLTGLSRVGNCEDAFGGCTELSQVTFAGIDTFNAESFAGMFRNCSSLAALDLSSFDTRSAMSMKRMFHGCRALESVTFGENFTFFGHTKSRLPGSELPSGAWQRDGDGLRAYASDSLPNFKAGTYRKVDETTAGLVVESVRGESEEGSAKYTIESKFVENASGDVEVKNAYIIDDDTYASDEFVLGESAKANSTKELSNKTVTKQTVTSVYSKRVTTIKIGPQVAKIGERAFENAPKVTWLEVQSPKLVTKARVKNCLTGSRIKHILFRVASKEAGVRVRAAFLSYSGKIKG